MASIDAAPHPDELPDGLLVIGADARVVAMNAAAEKMSGLAREDVVGFDVRTVFPLQDTSGRRWWDATDPWGGLATRTGHRERLLQLTTGPKRGSDLLVTARYVRSHRLGPVTQVVLQVRDTEARRRAEADHAGLISTVAHELRSPLTSVKGFTATLLRNWDRFTDEQKQLMLATVELDADRVTRLITELLDISRIDAGRLQVRRQPVDVLARVHAHVERLTVSGQPADRFAVTAPDPLPEVWADPDRLDQVLANLLENAIRHGEGVVSVSVLPVPVELPDAVHSNGAEPASSVEVTVDDEGEGIRDEHLGMVFTRFWRGSRRGGTGLGLYVVRGLVEAHGGRISVGHSPAGGARFRFTLPAGAPEGLG